jgi:thiol-disulfide isomerase/thioredoxin
MFREIPRWIAIAAYLCGCLFAYPSAGQSDLVDFKLTDFSGQEHVLSDYRDRWVIVNFWATWCGPCIKEIPELIRFQNEHHPRAQVLGINFEQTALKEIQRYIDELQINYPVLRIDNEPLVPFEPLKGLPTTFLVTPQGKIVYRHLGPLSGEQLKRWSEHINSSS